MRAPVCETTGVINAGAPGATPGLKVPECHKVRLTWPTLIRILKVTEWKDEVVVPTDAVFTLVVCEESLQAF